MKGTPYKIRLFTGREFYITEKEYLKLKENIYDSTRTIMIFGNKEIIISHIEVIIHKEK